MIQNKYQLHQSSILQGHAFYPEALASLHLDTYTGVFAISQEVIWQHHGQQLESVLQELAPRYHKILLPDGEAVKSLQTFEKLQIWLAKCHADRKSLIVVLGGGVVGDLAGFVAATYMRGIDWVYLPTTLLAQQDASVGGKVAVNLPQGKNLVGRFWDPKAVLIDTSVLATLPKRQINAGFMELLKHGMLHGEELLNTIQAVPTDVKEWQDFGELLWRGLGVKRAIVERDPFEKGERRLLNLGHTFGHALESAFGYKGWLHGEAVGLGLLFAAALASQLEESTQWEGLADSILPRMPAFDAASWDRDQLLELTRLDKKGVGGDIPWIIPYGPGNVKIESGIKIDTLHRAYGQFMEWVT